MRLVDRYGRRITYLRVSVTDRCNLRCIYCGTDFQRLRHEDILRYEEIIRIIDLFVRLGIRKVRITGGEPLLRKNIGFFLKELSKIDGIEELAITTNGILLEDFIDQIKEAGIRRINISLDTLRPERYREITGRDEFYKVLNGIYKAKEKGFDPIKINVVLLKGINEDEIMDFVDLSIKEPFCIRFIEYMPTFDSNRDFFISGRDVKRMIQERFKLIEVKEKDSLYPGPAIYYRVEGAKGKIGFIDAISSHFCSRCNRIRLTADGNLVPCLFSSKKIDIKNPMRSGAKDEDLIELILKAVKEKPSSHMGDFIKDSMYMIGG